MLFISCQSPQTSKYFQSTDSLTQRVQVLQNSNKQMREKLLYYERGHRLYDINAFYLQDSLSKFLNSSNRKENTHFVDYFLSYPFGVMLNEKQKIPLKLLDSNKVGNYNYPYLKFWYSARLFQGSSSCVPQDQLSHYYLTETDRSSENLKKLFYKYESVIYSLVDKQLYKDIHLNYIIQELLKSFEVLKKRDFDAVCQQITDKHLDVSSYPFEKLFGYKEDELPKNISFIHWTGSFWYRRYLEGNTEVVYEILKRVDAHYHRSKK